LARLHGLEQVGFAAKVMSHPAYDAFWQDQALDKNPRQAKGVAVRSMLVHSLWGPRDIYGNIALYKALKARGSDNPDLYLVIGPWFHHQERLDGGAVGPIRFGSDTAQYFRLHVLRPFLDHYLKDDPAPLKLPAVTAFETGTNRWQELPTWPSGCASGCRIDHEIYIFQAGGNLHFSNARRRCGPISMPMSPIRQARPYLPRPSHRREEGETNWQTWLVGDQRDAASRTDVLSFATPVLTDPVKISGQPLPTSSPRPAAPTEISW